MYLRFAVFLALFSCIVAQSRGGEIYEITSADGKTSYKFRFGEGKAGGTVMLAFDPEAKKFVSNYIKDERPDPSATIWDHTTGAKISLYKFKGASQLLPEIKDVKDIKYFPLTKDKDFKLKLVGHFD